MVIFGFVSGLIFLVTGLFYSWKAATSKSFSKDFRDLLALAVLASSFSTAYSIKSYFESNATIMALLLLDSIAIYIALIGYVRSKIRTVKEVKNN